MPTKADKMHGRVAGVPLRFVHGHNTRRSPDDYAVDEGTGCWLWQRSVLKRWGYGMAWRDGKHVLAHRWFYEQAKGAIPTGHQLDHLCRNRACVNPDHLEVVTRRENMHRGANTKLTDETVAEIRNHIAAHGPRYGRRALAEKYGVSEATIKDINMGKTWLDRTVPT